MSRKIPASQAVEPEGVTASAEDLLSILDSLDAAVYASDMQTHELLFLNAYGRQTWGAPRGRKCWEVLQEGQSGPCDFCTNDRLLDAQGRPGAPVVWEFQNTQNGRWYQCRDQAIAWHDGRLVRVEIATDITERKALEDALKASHRHAEWLAYRDELTQLLNRRAFFAACQERLATLDPEAPFALLLIDLDRFKLVNDTHGHAAGDRVLREVAKRFQARLRDGDILCRFGGEEFALALPGTSQAAASELAERLRRALSAQPMNYGEASFRVTASFGVVAAARGEADLGMLLQRADQAMYRAKREGRDRVCDSP